MVDSLKSFLESVGIYVRKHWKFFTALGLSFLAVGLVFAFPVGTAALFTASTLFTDMVMFDIFAIMVTVEEYVIMAAAAYAIIEFFAILASTGAFNFIHWAHKILDKYVLSRLEIGPKIALFIAPSLAIAIATGIMFALGVSTAAIIPAIWAVPVAIVAFLVVKKIINVIDEKFNPRCDFVRLSPNTNLAVPLSLQIQRALNYPRSYFIITQNGEEKVYQLDNETKKLGLLPLSKPVSDRKFKDFFPEKVGKNNEVSYLDVRKYLKPEEPIVSSPAGVVRRLKSSGEEKQNSASKLRPSPSNSANSAEKGSGFDADVVTPTRRRTISAQLPPNFPERGGSQLFQPTPTEQASIGTGVTATPETPEGRRRACTI